MYIQGIVSRKRLKRGCLIIKTALLIPFKLQQGFFHVHNKIKNKVIIVDKA